MMLVELFVALVAFASPGACSIYYDAGLNLFLDPLTTGDLAVFCFFNFLFLLLMGWCFATLIMARGYRLPYALLFITLVLTVLGNAATIALIILTGMGYGLNVQLSLTAISGFFFDWGNFLLFLAIIAVLLNREGALRVATDGNYGKRNPIFIVVHAIIAALILIFGTASMAIYVDARLQYLNAVESSSSGSAIYRAATAYFQTRYNLYRSLSYVYKSFVIISAVDVVVATILQWRAGRAAGLKDKVMDVMLYVVAPLYGVLQLAYMIFAIFFSPSGFTKNRRVSLTDMEGAYLADDIIITFFLFAVMAALLFIGAKRTTWNGYGGSVQTNIMPAQPYYSHPMQPYYGHQPPMQPYGQPGGQPAFYYNGPQPYGDHLQQPPTQYAQVSKESVQPMIPPHQTPP